MHRKLLIGLMAGITAAGGAAVLPATQALGGAGGPTLVVDTTVDDGGLDECTAAPDDCSLRGALQGRAQSDHVDGVTITVDVPAGTYELDEEIFLFNANVVVHGAGVDETTIFVDTTSDAMRHLQLSPDGELAVTLTDMTFTGGLESDGGSIRSSGGADLTVQRAHFVDNTARRDGGAIAARGNINADTLVIEDTTFAGNSAIQLGGAIHVSEGESATITNSTFTDNVAAFGGALFVGEFEIEVPASATLLHVTMAGNQAHGFQGDPAGGAIGVGPTADVELTATVIEASTEGEQLTPVAVGDPVDNCFLAEGASITSGGSNVVDDDTCETTEPTDQPDTAADVQALADNGGPTDTMALLAASPAVDAAGATCPVSDDQRGVARPQDGDDDGTNGCDSGAFELAATPDGPPPPTTPPPAAQPAQVTPTFTG